jgi:predicted dehydrogenase
MIRVGVVGYGYWGPNLVRNFAEAEETQIVGVSDLRPHRLALAQKRYPAIQTTEDYKQLLANPSVDAIAISTPISTHFPLAMQALKAGKHVLLEKPMASSSAEAETLIEEADRRKLVLMVDHSFVYAGAVRKIGDIVRSGAVGDLLYYDSTRINLGLFQHDADVIWDLAVHDFAIIQHLLPGNPCAVTATGVSHVSGRMENIAYITVFYENNLIAHINVNWLSPVKVRRVIIGGSKQMVIYDDTEASEKVKIYDSGITVSTNPDDVYKLLIGYRNGDMHSPRTDTTEALAVEVRHFADCIANGTRPITDGQAGLDVIRLLEAASFSMKARGRLVPLQAWPSRPLSKIA